MPVLPSGKLGRRNRPAINKEIAPELMKRSAAEWDEDMVEVGVPAGRVLSVPEILSHAHLSGPQLRL